MPKRPFGSVTGPALLLLLLLPSGCASAPDAVNPVSWWHSLEGGPIAAKRPPAPGATAPYPNLASVPLAPSFLSAEERARISAVLLADRTHAEQRAVLEPLPGPAPPPVAPPPVAPPVAEGAASASLPAVSSTATPAEAPAGAGPSAASATSASPTLAAAAANLPNVPLAPPPPPSFADIGLPGPPPAPFSAAPAGWLSLHFAPGSAALSARDRARLGGFARRRGGAAIAVIGFGDAAASDTAAQSAALRLGLARAASVATALAAAGVPESALRLQAEATGSGAVVRMVP